MRFLVVGKPWKGGLSKYVFNSLEDVFPGQVKWIPTYPNTFAEYINYRRDKLAWSQQLINQINNDDYDVAIFIKHYSIFNQLRTDRRNILWMTDAPTIQRGEDTPFERIFITDLGYETELVKRIDPSRYRGELALACYPKLHHPKANIMPEKDVCFIGNKDKLRDKGLEYLIDHNVNPAVYGDYFLRSKLFWQNPRLFHPRISNEQMQSVYAKYKVSVNIHAQVVRQGTNMRTFECAAYGIPQVVDYRHGLDGFFQDNDEILISHYPEQMVKQVQYLLSNPTIALQMALRARQRALNEHSYYHRLLYSLQDWLTPKALTNLQQTCNSLASLDSGLHPL